MNVSIRIDGTTFDGSYADAAGLVARQASRDAEGKQPERTKRAAKATVRKAAQGLRERLIVEDAPAVDGTEADTVKARVFRDLRAVYSDKMIQALLAANQIRRQSDDAAAMQAAEMLLLT